jgi:hypothetical protein
MAGIVQSVHDRANLRDRFGRPAVALLSPGQKGFLGIGLAGGFLVSRQLGFGGHGGRLRQRGFNRVRGSLGSGLDDRRAGGLGRQGGVDHLGGLGDLRVGKSRGGSQYQDQQKWQEMDNVLHGFLLERWR